MKELMNKAGDLAMVIDSHQLYDGMVVQCIRYQVDCWWKVCTKQGRILHFEDHQLIPLGGERILINEPQPELTQGSEAEVEEEEV